MGIPSNAVRLRKAITLSDEPPDRFLIFVKGENETTKGSVIFDDGAASAVMAAFNDHGVDGMIDLEHLSLCDDSKSYNPDAMGWYSLSVEDGDLWAVNVRWTPEGDQRIRQKKQRYISPVVFVDKDGRAECIFNVALTAMPATKNAAPLIAASRRLRMDELLEKLINALGLEEGASADDVLQKVAELMAAVNGQQNTDDPDAADDPDAVQTNADDPDATDAAAENKQLTAIIRGMAKRLNDLENANKRSEVDRLIAENVNKLPPALESWARSQDVKTLSAYFKAAPAVHNVDRQARRETRKELTAEERDMAKRLSIDPVKMMEYKNGKN